MYPQKLIEESGEWAIYDSEASHYFFLVRNTPPDLSIIGVYCSLEKARMAMNIWGNAESLTEPIIVSR